MASVATSEDLVPVPLYQAKADFFRTLGHPARIRVLELLTERDHAVHELLAAIDIEPSNLSQQLAVLRRAGLVVQRREAGEVVYSVSVPEVKDLLLAGRAILRRVAEEQGALGRELRRGTVRARR
ncbi:MAG TPA: metalloregulator ArsR/SmtB family transcription factor [Candidatus Nanopelagicales bacterium]|nr:metalloregulator ArsR/SmtB family transcription factor [Candidatus Nanopelagicales bacterium]